MSEGTEKTRSRSGLARLVVTIALGAVTGVQFVIWLLMCLISMSFKSPFWRWTLGGGAIVLAVWWSIDRRGSGNGSE